MTTNRFNIRIMLLTVSLGFLGLAAGATMWRIYQARNVIVPESLIVLPEPRIITDFALVDQAGNSFSLQGFKGHWSLVFFGFTSCPDVCPNTLFQLKQVRSSSLEVLSKDNVPLIYLISVDPDRDTPTKLADYLSYFDPEFIGLTGDSGQLESLAKQLSIAFFVAPHEPGNEQYNVDHSAAVLLLNPDGQLHGVFPAPHEAEKITHDVVKIIH